MSDGNLTKYESYIRYYLTLGFNYFLTLMKIYVIRLINCVVHTYLINFYYKTYFMSIYSL